MNSMRNNWQCLNVFWFFFLYGRTQSMLIKDVVLVSSIKSFKSIGFLATKCCYRMHTIPNFTLFLWVDFSWFSFFLNSSLSRSFALLSISSVHKRCLLNQHLFIEQYKFNGILYQRVVSKSLRLDVSLDGVYEWCECVIMCDMIFVKSVGKKMKKNFEHETVKLTDSISVQKTSLFSHPCTHTLIAR